MPRTLVAGVDSSTQATKVVVRDASTGELVREARASHPPGTEVHPSVWWDAFEQATAGGMLEGVAAVAVGAQQHGLVLLDGDGRPVRPALLWNDTRSAAAAADLVAELGGPEAWASAVGTVPVASLTVSKLRWVAEREPDLAARAETVLLPHDYLTWRLSGARSGFVTDRGDASGTGYWSPAGGDYRSDLLELAFGRELGLPRVLAPNRPAGETADGVLVAAGTGDNMAAALGVAIGPGDIVVSIGTSGTAFAVHDRPTADPTGSVAGFADATGRFLPLVCTLNAAPVLTAVASMLGTDLAGLDDLALAAPAGAEGVVLVPYFEGERTPNRPSATGTIAGLRLRNATAANLARAAVEGVLCGLADGVEALGRVGVAASCVVLVGGGARSRAVQAVAGTVFGCPVVVPAPREFVADGAARQAAWALTGQAQPPVWGDDSVEARGRRVAAAPAPHIRLAYAEARDR